jgi:hypothetical protein
MFVPMLGMPHSSRAMVFIHAPVDLCDLIDPRGALAMLQTENFSVRPVKVVRQVRYLLAEPF